jgi:uncharacterized protein (UPF0332 family)
VLFRAAGRASKRHDAVIQQFSLLVRDSNDTLRSAGKAFNEVKDERTAADDDEMIARSPEDAKQAQQAANNFLAICGVAYGLRPPSP